MFNQTKNLINKVAKSGLQARQHVPKRFFSSMPPPQTNSALGMGLMGAGALGMSYMAFKSFQMAQVAKTP